MSKIILINPKFPHNLGGAIRAAAIFGGIDEVLFSGARLSLDGLSRLPREERMKDYSHINYRRFSKPLNHIGSLIPVCVERLDNSEPLWDFIHPHGAAYIFGPEDGSIPKSVRHLCHRFVHIPGNHCLNLSAAVNVVLYDRNLKC